MGLKPHKAQLSLNKNAKHLSPIDYIFHRLLITFVDVLTSSKRDSILLSFPILPQWWNFPFQEPPEVSISPGPAALKQTNNDN